MPGILAPLLPWKVTGMSAGQFVRKFEWDFAKYAVRQRLPALVSLIQGGVGKIEEEHRNLSMVFSEKNQAMQVGFGGSGGYLWSCIPRLSIPLIKIRSGFPGVVSSEERGRGLGTVVLNV